MIVAGSKFWLKTMIGSKGLAAIYSRIGLLTCHFVADPFPRSLEFIEKQPQ